MNKEILYPVAAALLTGVATWFVANGTDFSSKHQREKIATEIMSDDEFLTIVARDIMEDENFLKALKRDDGFRGEKGESPSVKDVAALIQNDVAFLKEFSKTPYKLLTSNNKTKNIITNKHAFCSVTGIEFNYGGTGSNKICITRPNPDGTWLVEARAEGNQNIVCTATCF